MAVCKHASEPLWELLAFNMESQSYLPPGRGDIPAFNHPIKAGTRI